MLTAFEARKQALDTKLDVWEFLRRLFNGKVFNVLKAVLFQLGDSKITKKGALPFEE